MPIAPTPNPFAPQPAQPPQPTNTFTPSTGARGQSTAAKAFAVPTNAAEAQGLQNQLTKLGDSRSTLIVRQDKANINNALKQWELSQQADTNPALAATANLNPAAISLGNRRGEVVSKQGAVRNLDTNQVIFDQAVNAFNASPSLQNWQGIESAQLSLKGGDPLGTRLGTDPAGFPAAMRTAADMGFASNPSFGAALGQGLENIFTSDMILGPATFAATAGLADLALAPAAIAEAGVASAPGTFGLDAILAGGFDASTLGGALGETATLANSLSAPSLISGVTNAGLGGVGALGTTAASAVPTLAETLAGITQTGIESLPTNAAFNTAVTASPNAVGALPSASIGNLGQLPTSLPTETAPSTSTGFTLDDLLGLGGQSGALGSTIGDLGLGDLLSGGGALLSAFGGNEQVPGSATVPQRDQALQNAANLTDPEYIRAQALAVREDPNTQLLLDDLRVRVSEQVRGEYLNTYATQLTNTGGFGSSQQMQLEQQMAADLTTRLARAENDLVTQLLSQQLGTNIQADALLLNENIGTQPTTTSNIGSLLQGIF